MDFIYLPPEIINHIYYYLDYMQSINLANTCRTFRAFINNDQFWYHKTIANFNITEDNYPLLTSESYRARYLRLATFFGYICPGSEKYVSVTNIFKQYRKIDTMYKPYFLARHRHTNDGLNWALRAEAKTGQLDKVQHLLSLGADDYEELVIRAAKSGHLSLVQRYKNKIFNYSNVLYAAAYGGNIAIVRSILDIDKFNTTEYNMAICEAAERGHKYIVNLLLDYGSYDYDRYMISAAKGGNIDIVLYMLNNGATHYKSVMMTAAYYGHDDIIRLMLSKGANNYNETLGWALRGSHTSTIQLMLYYITEYDNIGYNTPIIYAALYGDIEILKQLLNTFCSYIELRDYNRAMVNAAQGGHIHIVQFLLHRGANSYHESISEAIKHGHINIVKLLLPYCTTHFSPIFNDAIKGGHISIIRLVLNKSFTDLRCHMSYHDYSRALDTATNNGHVHIIQLLLKYDMISNHLKLNIYVRVMSLAAHKGYTTIVLLMLNYIDIDNYDEIITHARDGHNYDIVQLLEQRKT